MAGPNTAAAASGHIAKELGNWGEVLDYYKRPSELFNECGRVQPAADALAKGARALEEASPDEAIQLYTDACFLLEEDGREQMAFDLYRAGTSVYLKPERYDDAATFLPRFGLSADHCNAVNSQCKEPTKLDSNKSGDGKDDVTAVVKVLKKKTKELGAQKAVDNIRAEDYIAAPAESSKRKKSRQS